MSAECHVANLQSSQEVYPQVQGENENMHIQG